MAAFARRGIRQATMEELKMTTAVIGIGNIGKSVAKHLANGGEQVIVASRDNAQAVAFAKELGVRASAASVKTAISDADNIVFAVLFDTMKDLITTYKDLLEGKIVIDPSNPIKPAEGGKLVRTLPDGVSSGTVIAGLLPAGAHFVKAFGTLGADALAGSANRSPQRAALFYATNDDLAAKVIERLITAAGFDPVKAGGVKAALRIEVFGDLHQFGGLNGQVLTRDLAKAAVKAKPQTIGRQI
jgi:predicted dinucleotide-binding enzyme